MILIRKNAVVVYSALVSGVVVLGLSATTFAASGAAACSRSFLGFPTWFKYLPMTPPPDCTIITNNLGGQAALLVLMALIEILLVLAGIAALGFIIFGSYKFILSQGDPQKVAGARTTIANAVVGLIIAIIASRVVSFIAGRLS